MPVAKQRRSNPSSGMTFINVTHPNEIGQRSTQRTIRSSAMAAIGRSRRKRPGKPVVVELDLLQASWPDEEQGIDPDGLATVRLYNALKLQRIPPALPHLGIFAVEPDHRARELMHFMSGEAQHVYRPFRAEWFSMALLEPSSYFLCLANAALFMNQHVTQRISLEYTDSTESTWYYSKCLTKLTRQLDCHAKDITEGAIITVLGFVCHSFAIGKWERGEMHMQGLERIIRLRGGFQGLGDFSPLFASWFDITNSAVHDIKPRLPYPVSMEDSPTRFEQLPSTLIGIISELDTSEFDFARLREGLWSMAQLASYVDRHSQQPSFWEAGVKSTLLVGPAAHSILSIPRLNLPKYLDGNRPCSALLLQETVRLALLILVAILKKALSLVAHELGTLLEKFSILTPLMAHVSFFPELRLWAYLVAACARDGPNTQLHLSEIRRAMGDLQLGDGGEAVATAKSIIWFYSLLGKQIEKVKEQINYTQQI